MQILYVSQTVIYRKFKRYGFPFPLFHYSGNIQCLFSELVRGLGYQPAVTQTK